MQIICKIRCRTRRSSQSLSDPVIRWVRANSVMHMASLGMLRLLLSLHLLLLLAVTSRHADSESETEWGQDCIAMDENPQSIWHLKPTAVDKN